MSKIFDDYQVDCNECKKYWDSSCDGVPINKKRNCTSFEATRTTDIPKQIERLNKSIKHLWLVISVLGIGLLLIGVNI
mgnify:CR=1 FL=1